MNFLIRFRNSCSEPDNFLSGSWDHTIKLWDPRRKQSLRTFADHRFEMQFLASMMCR